MTSGTRTAVPVQPSAGQPKVTSSTNGRCGSRSERRRATNDDSSASEPTQGGGPSPAGAGQGRAARGTRAATPPDRQRRPPVAFSGQRRVDLVLEPVAVPAVLDRR